MITAIWLACTTFVAGFLYRQLPEVYQDLTFGLVVVALVLVYR